ncbi:hypothetical protein ASG39_18680 [Rhizobium sp. Leaf371]|uniref:hypothetical protein n=1 Tax=Rhizobium sp. Leaf371 TaxID=1736355 RepID=UPI000713A5A5|nr:hypothetical protein [Rhizobium sp. Leaf371]KQS59347.1 hypothetical protein ASG39_18680 [Rhizobium sp. Leaf371]
MIVTVAFDVKNHVEVMEGWPIKLGNTTFYLEREGNVLKRVCVSFSGIDIAQAPYVQPAGSEAEIPHITIQGGEHASRARKSIMNWQAVISGQQIVDLDFDNYELRFRAEDVSEEASIHLKSFRSNNGNVLNQECDFEQIGRAFCVGQISDDRIESTSHFREGRLAYAAKRYVDAYNNMYLFLETRFCDGKTGNEKQTDLLSKQLELCQAIENTAMAFAAQKSTGAPAFNLFNPDDTTREKIRTLVLLRGKLRHHSLKSPQRWDPNKQNEYESAARYLGAVVGEIVTKESLDDIYVPAVLQSFREISVATGHETKIKVRTHRLNRERMLELDMSYPTMVLSSKLCLSALRSAVQACEEDGQLGDTVRLQASSSRSELELFSLDFDVWAYTQSRAIEVKDPIVSVWCGFEHYQAGVIVRHEFSIPVPGSKLSIPEVWELLRKCFDHIEERNPTTRVMSLKLYLQKWDKAFAAYRVGVQVNN